MNQYPTPPARPDSTTEATVGISLVSLLLLGVLTTVVMAILIPSFGRGAERSRVSRARSDQRSIATALEAYRVDQGAYPAMTLDRTLMVDADHLRRKMPAGRTFRSRGNSQMATLTTPIAYITSYPKTPVKLTRGLTHRYHTEGDGWILGWWGNDEDWDGGGQLLWDLERQRHPITYVNEVGEAVTEMFEFAYTARVPQPSQYLITGSSSRGAFTFDPTNGANSQGDVWRVKQ